VRVGMMWLDGDHRIDLCTRIERAAMYYRDKYGEHPNLCVIHPSTAGASLPDLMTGIDVRTSFSVLPDHFWLGIDDQSCSITDAKRVAA
jgi:hypothetical protein